MSSQITSLSYILAVNSRLDGRKVASYGYKVGFCFKRTGNKLVHIDLKAGH